MLAKVGTFSPEKIYSRFFNDTGYSGVRCLTQTCFLESFGNFLSVFLFEATCRSKLDEETVTENSTNAAGKS